MLMSIRWVAYSTVGLAAYRFCSLIAVMMCRQFYCSFLSFVLSSVLLWYMVGRVDLIWFISCSHSLICLFRAAQMAFKASEAAAV